LLLRDNVVDLADKSNDADDVNTAIDVVIGYLQLRKERKQSQLRRIVMPMRLAVEYLFNFSKIIYGRFDLDIVIRWSDVTARVERQLIRILDSGVLGVGHDF
jgi:hypothetical protein